MRILLFVFGVSSLSKYQRRTRHYNPSASCRSSRSTIPFYPSPSIYSTSIPANSSYPNATFKF